MRWTTLATPIGDLYLAANDNALIQVEFAGVAHGRSGTRGDSAILTLARRQLTEYFAGKRTEFDLPLEMTGTDLQLKVWRALERIPFGKTRTYGQLAVALTKKTQTARAVGVCCGRNPLPVIIPCHRVLGTNGALTGFGGGIWRKEWLLKHEGVLDPELML
ncbi:methylated-DNA--[protein]-cysteine S-methyltransferase [candidate division KSB1 bacterium]|nr:methylated-DNA--[protein]-cysteine S-methyltransferase [candidate division KSB1 bacterium]